MKNWKTTLFGGIAVLAGFVSQYPQQIISLAPPQYSAPAAKIIGLIALFIAFYHAQDAAPAPKLPAPGSILKALLVLLIPACLLGLGACAGFSLSSLAADAGSLVSNPASSSLVSKVSADVQAIEPDLQTAYNDASAAATLYQAYVSTGLPVPAAVTKATVSTAKVGIQLGNALSAIPATQAVANDLFAVAAKLAPAPVASGTDAGEP